MDLVFDARARRLLDHSRPGQAVLITIVGNYGLPGTALTAEWCQARQAECDPDLLHVDSCHGVPIFAHRRVAAYARWHELPITARSFGWWPTFAVAHAGEICRDLVRWERLHPGLCAQAHGTRSTA